jgi:hypothetical protein
MFLLDRIYRIIRIYFGRSPEVTAKPYRLRRALRAFMNQFGCFKIQEQSPG